MMSRATFPAVPPRPRRHSRACASHFTSHLIGHCRLRSSGSIRRIARHHYEALCRVVKKASVYDRESGLWVKRASQDAFAAYRAEEKKALDELVERNRKYAIEVLGGIQIRIG